MNLTPDEAELAARYVNEDGHPVGAAIELSRMASTTARIAVNLDARDRLDAAQARAAVAAAERELADLDAARLATLAALRTVRRSVQRAERRRHDALILLGARSPAEVAPDTYGALRLRLAS